MITPLASRDLVDGMNLDIGPRAEALAIPPHLMILEGVGRNRLGHEVRSYVAGKLKVAQQLGVVASHYPVPVHELRDWIADASYDWDTHGIIVEEPIPDLSRGQARGVLDLLDGAKAVDNQGRYGRWGMGATSEATVRLLDYHGYTGDDQTVLVVGTGNVGAPLVGVYGDPRRKVRDLLVVDASNKDELPQLAKAANMIIVATGHENTLTPDMVQEDHIIAVVGARDAHPDVRDITDRNFTITPEKGGVGPLTIRTLLSRVVHLAEGGEPGHPFIEQPLVPVRG